MAQRNATHWLDNMPDYAHSRAYNYRTYGVPKSQSKATALRDVGYSNKDVSNILEVTPDAASSYYSKFSMSVVNETLPLALSVIGGPKRVMSWTIMQDTKNDTEYWYILKPIDSTEDIQDAKEHPPKGNVVLVKICATDAEFSAESQMYSSLESMANEIYTESEFSEKQTAYEIHVLLTEAGLPLTSIEDPREKTR